jgi:hypothetical protein
MGELASIFQFHGTDKYHHHRYDLVYEWLLAPLCRIEGLRLLEIGVAGGHSLRAWEDYFPLAEIVGLDSKRRCQKVQRKKAKVVWGKSGDEDLLKSLGDFDVVIDDGSHYAQDQLASFQILWPRTRRVYCIEDVRMKIRPVGDPGVHETCFQKILEDTKEFGAIRGYDYCTCFAGNLVAFVRIGDGDGS